MVGLAASGEAVARQLQARGWVVAAIDDAPDDTIRVRARRLGVELVSSPDEAALEELVGAADVVVPSPGIPLGHALFRLADRRSVPVRGDVELASGWTEQPIVAITGTNGKTTVTGLVTDMLVASGVRAVAAGNIGLPLAEAVQGDAEVFVVETSSFQLAVTNAFRPAVAVWLNAAPDHLESHGTFEAYVASKARIWRRQGAGDVAVVNADDPIVMEQAAGAPGRVVTFGLVDGDYRVRDGVLREPGGGEIAPAEALGEALDHEVANVLAAAAAAIAAGASLDGVRIAAAGFRRLPHRMTSVGEAGGVRWYDDSKATNPHATVAALRGFPSVVLIAGGRNKGLDLSVLADSVDHVRAVVAIGEAAGEVETAFRGLRPVRPARSMRQAVERAGEEARPGDVVLLSPACASFDWYGSYAERGDDFTAAVGDQLALDRDARRGRGPGETAGARGDAG